VQSQAVAALSSSRQAAASARQTVCSATRMAAVLQAMAAVLQAMATKRVRQQGLAQLSRTTAQSRRRHGVAEGRRD